VLHWSGSALRTVLPDRPMVGGLCLTRTGDLLVSGSAVDRYSVDGVHVSTVLSLDDIRVDKPGTLPRFNDLAADAGGRLWVGVIRSDTSSSARVPGEVVLLSPREEAVVVLDDIYPNGVCFSPDGTLAYLADTFGRRVVVVSVESLRVVGEWSTSDAIGHPDGIVADRDGGVWVAQWRGKTIDRYVDGATALSLNPGAMPLSLAFDDADPHRLWVVTGPDEHGDGAGDLLVHRCEVAGVPPERAELP